MPRLMVLGTCLLCVQSVTLTAQQPAASPAPNPASVTRPLGSPSPRIQGLSGTLQSSVFSTIEGRALDADNNPLPRRAVRLRDTRTGKIVEMRLTDAVGVFAFRNVEPGNYVVELLSAQERVLAASNMITVTAGDTASTIVKLPLKTRSLLGLLGHNTSAAAIVASSAAAAGVLAVRVKDCVSPPCEN